MWILQFSSVFWIWKGWVCVYTFLYNEKAQKQLMSFKRNSWIDPSKRPELHLFQCFSVTVISLPLTTLSNIEKHYFVVITGERRTLLAYCLTSQRMHAFNGSIGPASSTFLSPPTRHRCCSPGSLPLLHSSSAYTMFPLCFRHLPPRLRLRKEKRVPSGLQLRKREAKQVKHEA